MIQVHPKPEPTSFNTTVRIPGNGFLRSCGGKPTAWQGRNFWKNSLNELRQAYGGICAYSSLWIPQGGSIDHFIPKSIRPDLAYEWSNYRFCTERINNYKGDSQGLLDPFTISDGWFTLNFGSFFVECAPHLPTRIETAVKRTISVLCLNRDDNLIQSRYEITRDYARGELPLSYLKKRYPFIAFEIVRQGVEEKLKTQRW